MKIVTVIPLKKGILKEDLTYFTAKNVALGDIVAVPIRKKEVLGLVIAIDDVSSAKIDIKEMDFNLRKISEVKGASLFSREYLESAFQVSKYFVANKNNIATSLIPSIFREKYDTLLKLFQQSEEKNLSTLNEEKTKKDIRSEKLIFQAPIEDRIASYKTLIRELFAVKKSVFVVLPTESDIKIFHEFLARGIEQFTFSLHSGLSAKKIIQTFEHIVARLHPVLIIGTAPFLSIPRNDIGTVILEHESSQGYKMIANPHLDLRVFVELFTSKIKTKLILGDTLLSFDTLGRSGVNSLTNTSTTEGFTSMHPLSFRINFDGKIEVIGKNLSRETVKNEENKEEKFKIIAEKSEEKIRNAISKKKSVFVFALRKGLATETICRDCGETLVCDKCFAPVVLYLSRDGEKRIFSCNRCKRKINPETKCPNCESWNLVPLGIGTDTIYEEIKKIFGKPNSEIKIFKLDKETVRNKKEAEKTIKEFEENPGSILVGTEMALFYIKKKIPISIIASFNSLWSIPNFRMSEKIIQLMLSIISRTENEFIIETKNINDPAILALEEGNLLSFVRGELEERKKLNYPPFVRFIKITFLGDKNQTEIARNRLKEILNEYNPEIFSGFVEKLKGKYATSALIRLDLKKWSLPELSLNSSIDENLFNKLASLTPTFNVFVDPEDLL